MTFITVFASEQHAFMFNHASEIMRFYRENVLHEVPMSHTDFWKHLKALRAHAVRNEQVFAISQRNVRNPDDRQQNFDKD